ncbi:MAG: phosphate-starvation-inducible PsiE family protein [Candidatus Brocadiaceae bacterium]|nr:phosphate-starvation-inducible PsiE family protein [Candidatus Brocadiaceae bacterium]
MEKQDMNKSTYNEELPRKHKDPLIQFLHKMIRNTVKALAILMTLVILWGTIDLSIDLYQKLVSPPLFLISLHEILSTFSGFLTVLIAIEIFSNITMYIRDDVLPIKLVLATALMAICRKVIVFEFKELTPMYIVATATVILALGISYWLISVKDNK